MEDRNVTTQTHTLLETAMPNNASTQHTGQYKKLNNGSYGAKVNSLPDDISIGDVVMVTKRSGDVVTRYVERVLFACTNYRTGDATGETVVALKIPRRGRTTGRTTSQVQDASQATRSASDPVVQGIMSAMEHMPVDVLRSLLVEGRLILERRGSSEETSKPSEEVSEEASEEVSEESSEESSEGIVEEVVIVETVEEKPDPTKIKTDFDDLWF
jgi:hypothetical protein